MQPSQEDQVIEHSHLLVESAFFRQISNALQLLPVEALTKETYLSFVGQCDTDHHADARGLARPIRAKQPIDGAFANVKRKVVNCDKIVVGLVNSAQVYDITHGWLRGSGPDRRRLIC